MKKRKAAKATKRSSKKTRARVPVSAVAFSELTAKVAKRLAPAPALVAPTFHAVPIDDNE